MYKLYSFGPSGNAYKVRLTLTQLQIPFDLVELNLLQGEHRDPAYLAKNPNGKVPALELEPGTVLAESGAILTYLTEGTPLLPRDQLTRARVMEWLFFEQFSLGPNLARPRFFISVAKTPEKAAHLMDYWYNLGNPALKVLDDHLRDRSFAVAETYTIADIALFSYVHMADQGGYDMGLYPNIAAWCDRVRAQPRYIPIA